MIPYSKNLSALAFQSNASGSEYESQVSMTGQDNNQDLNYEQTIEAGMGIVGHGSGLAGQYQT